MYIKKMYYGFIIVILIQQLNFICCQVHFPITPCPEFFKYVYDGSKWIAEITLPTPDVNEIVLIANFTVPDRNVQDIGTLYINNEDVNDDIKNKRPLIFTYILAKSKNIPQVTKITYNGDVLCVGPEISNPPYTTFTLAWSSFDVILVPLSPTNRPTNIPTNRPTDRPTNRPTNKPTNSHQNIPDHNLINTYQNDQNCGLIRNKRELSNIDSDVIHFIYNGAVVSRNNHPWLAALYHTDNGPLKFFCGGNLISNKHILSAAHCTVNKKNIKVKVGAHNTNDFFENGAIIRNVMKIINHREYQRGNGNADVSILILENTVGFTEFVKPICLWNNDDDLSTIIGDRGTIMGWGLTEKGDTSSIPLQTDIAIVSQQQCQSVEILKDAISNTTFCAGTKGAGPCMGDSGGGLLLSRQGRWYIRGIISISVGSRRLKICDVNTYAVYVDTAKYTNWIIDNMK